MDVLAIRNINSGDLVDIMINIVSNAVMFAWNFWSGHTYLFVYYI